jgi:hypothetical protein
MHSVFGDGHQEKSAFSKIGHPCGNLHCRGRSEGAYRDGRSLRNVLISIAAQNVTIRVFFKRARCYAQKHWRDSAKKI